MRRILWICSVLAISVCVPARSQFTQFTQPGSQAEVPEDQAEQAQQEADDARWRFGPLRLQPHLTLSDVGYIQNLYSAPEGVQQVDDTHATLGAGLAGYVRLGSKSLLSGYLAPQYFWWQDSRELRELTVNSGLAWFGDFNRLQVSAGLRDSERQKQLSFELQAPATILDKSLEFEGALRVTRRLGLFAVATDSRTRHGREIEQFVPGLSLASLDRDGTRRIAGLELRGVHSRIGLGLERTDLDFVSSNERDNTGEGPLLRVRYETERLRIDGTYSELDFDFDDPALPDGALVLGTALVAFKPRPNTTASVYLADRLSFTTISTEGIIESENLGLDLQQLFGERLEGRVFAETGTQTFVDRLNPGRSDELEAYGIMISLRLRENLTLTATVSEERWDSNVDNFDRTTSRVGFGIQFEGDLLPW